MPTGYTSDIEKGITFEKFAWGCARGMGALIMMRDMPHDAPIPERFEPSDYHKKELARERVALTILKETFIEDAQKSADSEYGEAMKHYEEYSNSKTELRGKYKAMLSKVEAWQPPSSDHIGFKDFMIEQIKGSIDFDCSLSSMPLPERRNAQEWLDEKTQKAISNIGHHERKYQEEVELTEKRNNWIKQLRESLNK